MRCDLVEQSKNTKGAVSGKTKFMSRQNDDIEQLKASVSCALVLERLQPDWRLDAAQSTRRNLKFRRGPGKILIVDHDRSAAGGIR